MNTFSPFIRWLALVAIVEWFIARTVTRSAIFMPKSPSVLVIYQGMTTLAQVLATLAALLALGGLLWIAWQVGQAQRRVPMWRTTQGWLALMLLSLVSLSLVFIVVPASGWWTVTYQLLVLATIAFMACLMRAARLPQKLAWFCVASAVAMGVLYQLLTAISAAWQWSQTPLWNGTMFNLGELVVVVSGIVLWWAYGREASWRVWLVAALPALAFTLFYVVNAELSGVMAIWSTGLTLYLPWPLYALSVWLMGVTFLASLRRAENISWAVLLLIACGYAPQLSAQLFLGLMALWLLATTPVDEMYRIEWDAKAMRRLSRFVA
jgi:hypothetical protein